MIKTCALFTRTFVQRYKYPSNRKPITSIFRDYYTASCFKISRVETLCSSQKRNTNINTFVGGNYSAHLSTDSKTDTQTINKDNEIFISNLSPEFTEEDIRKLFDSFGVITNVTLKERDDSIYSNVAFENEESALQAVSKMNGENIQGRDIVVKPSRKLKSNGYEIQISNLNKDIRQYELEETFKPYGEIISIDIRDGRSDLYSKQAFITYFKEDDAIRAIVNTDGTSLQLKRIKVRVSLHSRIQSFQVLVRNLPYGVSDEEVRELFNSFADIVGLLVRSNKNAKTCFAYIYFWKAEKAIGEILGMNDSVVDGNRIQVHMSEESNVKSYEICVDNLNLDISNNDLMSVFSPFGALNGIYIQRTKYEFGVGKAAVHFSDEAAAVKAILELDGEVLHGRHMSVKSTKNSMIKCYKVFVSGIENTVTEEEVRFEFQKFGDIIGIYVISKVEKFETQVAYLYYLNENSASTAIREMNGQTVFGKEIQVRVSKDSKFDPFTQAPRRKKKKISLPAIPSYIRKNINLDRF